MILAAEYFFKDQNSFQVEIAWQNQAFNAIGNFENLNGFSIQPSYNLHFHDGIYYKRTTYTMLSFGLDYGQQSYIRTDSFELEQPPIPATKNYTYSNKRYYIGGYAHAGIKTLFRRGLLIEFYLGIGFKINTIKNELSQDLADSRYFGDWTVPTNYTQNKGTSFIPILKWGLRIGLGFKRKK